MQRIQSVVVFGFAIMVAAWVAAWAIGSGGAATASAAPAADPCRTVALGLRERLESVTEAVIDGKLAAVPRAASRVAGWWQTQRQSMASRPQADSLIDGMALAAVRHHPRTAARIAVQLSAQSLAWCPGSPGTDDRLMLIDLAGMTGWLRARDERLDWPGDVHGASEALASQLVAGKHAPLAARLRSAVAATLSTPESAAGDVHAALRLLDLVDEIEKVLR